MAGEIRVRRIKMGQIRSPIAFYVTVSLPPSEESRLNIALSTMQTCYNLRPPPRFKSMGKKLKGGMKVAILVGPNQWKRAKIKGSAPSGKVEVIFIDSGIVDATIGYGDVYELTEPWASIHGAWRRLEIYGVKCQSDICGLALVQLFMSKAHQLWAVLHRSSDNGRVWSGDIVAQFTARPDIGCKSNLSSGFVSLSTFLVKEGLARKRDFDSMCVTCDDGEFQK